MHLGQIAMDQQAHSADPTRTLHAVVTGIGFLAGGAIIRDGANPQGLTTAATVFFAAALGCAVALGTPLLAAGAVAACESACFSSWPCNQRAGDGSSATLGHRRSEIQVVPAPDTPQGVRPPAGLASVRVPERASLVPVSS
ncbi:MAG: MgtC/SapB family protein [Nocardioides sp.]|nr:MgtC/SapB family protein [Nocardioides sp.]